MLKTATFLFGTTLLLMCSASGGEKNYHTINQPNYSTTDFLDDYYNNASITSQLYNAKFFQGKRIASWAPELEELIFRSLKGNIKTITIMRNLNDGKTETTLQYHINNKGEITKVMQAYHEATLTEIVIEKDKYDIYNITDEQKKRNDSVTVSDKEDFMSYKFYKGKPYAMYHLMGDILERYWYYDNGNKKRSATYTDWETSYYQKNGLLDSIIDRNSEKNPTEISKKIYTYNNGLMTRQFEVRLKVEGKKILDTLQTRDINLTYQKNSDLFVKQTDDSSYLEDNTLKKDKQLFTYVYNDKNLLVSETKMVNNRISSEYKYEYQYDKIGNPIDIKYYEVSDKTKAPELYYNYKITYEYY